MCAKIITTLIDGVFTVTLNNPEKHNCMGFEMLYALEEAQEEASKNEQIKAVVFKGAGSKSFSTGADLKEFSSLSPIQVNDWIRLGNEVYNKIESIPKPTVAYIQGYAMGGGLELALACDIRLGSERTLISSPELSHGWLPGWGGMQRLKTLIGEAQAKKVVMLCERISANEALSIGLITKILEPEHEEEQLNEIAKHLAGIHPEIYPMAKSALSEGNRIISNRDIQFDIMATHLSKKLSKD